MRTIRRFTALFLLVACLPVTAAIAGDATRRETKPTMQLARAVTPEAAVVSIALARELPPALNSADRKRLDRVVRELKQDDRPQAQRQWTKLMHDIAGSAAPVDVDLVVQWVLREAYVEPLDDLRDRADKVRFYNEQKRAVRDHLERSRQALSTMRRDSKVEIERISVVPRYTAKKTPVRVTGRRRLGDDELAREIREWEEKLQTIGEDAQLANIDLQDAMQKQQQTLQTISNVSKMLHDTAMAVIRKIG